MKCNNCKKELNFKNAKPNFWKEGDEGLKYRWNKIGEIKDYVIVCDRCHKHNHYLTL